MSEDMDSPVEQESEISPDDAPQEEVETESEDDIEAEDVSEGDTDEDIEFIETEYEGKTYKLPQELKDALMRNKDYTHKTMTLAEERKALEAEREQFQMTAKEHSEFIEDQVTLKAVETRLSEWEKVDWDTWDAENPVASQKGYRQYQNDQRQAMELKGSLQSKMQEKQQKLNAAQRQAMERGASEVAKIPGWSEQQAAKLTDLLTKDYGFPAEQAKIIRTDPRIAKLAMDAAAGKASRRQTAKPSDAPIKPVPKTTGAKSSSKMDLVKDAQKMSMDDWAKKRMAEKKAAA